MMGKVTSEAANLLYSGVEKEYKQAKLKAARTWGFVFFPQTLKLPTGLDGIGGCSERTRQGGSFPSGSAGFSAHK
jgi:hypothetical protein